MEEISSSKLDKYEGNKAALERRKENLSKYIQKWQELRAIAVMASHRTGGITNEDEAQFHEVKTWLSQHYARIEPEIRGAQLGQYIPALGIRRTYEPIGQLLGTAQSITYLVTGFGARREEFDMQWNAGLNALNVALGRVEAQIAGDYIPKSPPEASNEIIRIISTIRGHLRKAIREDPSSEKDVQDVLETIFDVAKFDFTREKEPILYSGKNYFPDFTFGEISTVVEVKLCNKIGKDKRIISEINDDIVAYSTKYANLIFVVYDVGIIRDADAFKGSISENPNVVVEIIKH
jgi:hypothetical protein